MKTGFVKVTDQENAKLDLSVYIQLVVQAVLLASTCMPVYQVLWCICSTFTLYGLLCEDKNAPKSH